MSPRIYLGLNISQFVKDLLQDSTALTRETTNKKSKKEKLPRSSQLLLMVSMLIFLTCMKRMPKRSNSPKSRERFKVRFNMESSNLYSLT